MNFLNMVCYICPFGAGGRKLWRSLVRKVREGGLHIRITEPRGAVDPAVYHASSVMQLNACVILWPDLTHAFRHEQHATPLFVSADVDDLREIGAAVRYTPTVAFYKGGRKVRSIRILYCNVNKGRP